MPEVIMRLPHVGNVVTRFWMNPGVNPATTGCAAVVLQLGIFANQLARTSLVSVDLAHNCIDHGFGDWALGGIVPRQGVQSRIARTGICLGFVFKSPAEVIYKPGFAAAVPGRFDRFFVELK